MQKHIVLYIVLPEIEETTVCNKQSAVYKREVLVENFCVHEWDVLRG